MQKKVIFGIYYALKDKSKDIKKINDNFELPMMTELY